MAAAEMNAIKNRIKSVTSTMQITKAMELVATSKLRHAKERAESTRPYQDAIASAIKEIRSYNEIQTSDFGEIRENPKTCIIVIAGDRGLAGGFNNNIFKMVGNVIKEKEENGEKVCILPVGKKAFEHYSKLKYELISTEYESVEELSVGKCFGIGNIVTGLFLEKKLDRVEICYTFFKSMLSQTPKMVKLLPLDPIERATKTREPLFDEDPYVMLERIVPQYVGGEVYVGICESFASECASRRSAMNSANKNAEEMINNLGLKYNQARQSVITQEITEIISGAEINHE